MCTLTWTRTTGGYVLFFNRDEKNTRGEEMPPRIEPGPTRWIAPIDSDFGGTWIAVNDRGVTVGLLNGRPEDPPRGGSPRSRGLLVRDLAPSPTLAAFEAKLAATDLSVVRSFRLFALAPAGSLLLAEWDGASLVIDRYAEHRRPLVSSSIEESEVGAHRRRAYVECVGKEEAPSPEQLEAFHRSHVPSASAFSVCMHREDARTRSCTRIDVDGALARLRSHAGSPCLPSPETEIALERIDDLADDARSALR